MDKIKKRNLILRKPPVGKPVSRGFSVPRNVTPEYAHGIRSKPTECMYDVMTNNYGKEWLLKTMAGENARRERKMMSTKISRNTLANIYRNEHIKRTISTATGNLV